MRGEGSNYVGYGDDRGWPVTARLLRQMFPPDHHPALLEFGCATGWFLKAAVEEGFLVFGVDPSPWALAHPASDMADLMVLGNAQTWIDSTGGSLSREQYDVVCSWEMLEHVEERDVEDALVSMWRCLKPGGLFVHRICLPGSDDHDHTHVTVKERQWWLNQMETRFASSNRLAYVERMFDSQFGDRDWAGRFFAWRKTERPVG